MPAAHQQTLYDRLKPALSEDRLGAYLMAAGFDPDRALALYAWNGRMGEAFHIPIQAVEVGLRNRVAQAFATVYGPEWWRDPKFRTAAGPARQKDIDVVLARLASERKPVTTGRVVAGLSFGFWVALLHRRHNPAVWSGQLRKVFVGLPKGLGRDQVHRSAAAVARLRNRIDHHEPIIKQDLSKAFADIMELLGWICPEKLAWVRPQCRVAQTLREKP